jgi:pimeloyl-ACP methyl ester carboxylesterase
MTDSASNPIVTPVRTFVLVPGAGGSAWYWNRVVPLLEAAGHRVIPVELPAADDSATLGDYAATIGAAGQGSSNIVMVAQSLGGFSAPMAVDELGAQELIFVNAMIPAPGESPGQWFSNTGQSDAAREMAERDGRSPDFDFVEDFFHDVPDDVRTAAFDRGEPVQSDTPMGSVFVLERLPDIPTRVISGRDDRLFPIEFQRRLATQRLGLNIEEIPGGHLIALSHPTQLADRLLARHD